MSWLSAFPILFGLAYSQQALFASNQNTKFISGLALAGYRNVGSDWMAHTTDAFPLFSHLLKWQYQLLGLHAGIHLAFFLILALYALSSLWLAKTVLTDKADRPNTILIFSLLWLFVHALGIRGIWLQWFPDGLAFQYLLGSYYQPCTFGVLLLTGIAAYRSRRFILAVTSFALAPLFHPAYLISSALIATVMVLVPANRGLDINWKRRLGFLISVGLVLAIDAFWSSQLLTSGDPAIREQAHQLLAEKVIPFHANPAKWPQFQTLAFFIFGLLASWIGRKSLIGQILFILLLFTAASILWAFIDYHPTLAVAAPWRVSVFLAPLSWILILLALARVLNRILSGTEFVSHVVTKGVLFILLGLVCFNGIQATVSDYQRKQHRDYFAVSRFLRNYDEAGNQYLVPVQAMNIRLEAGVAVFATWKSHPVKDSEFLQWYDRIRLARAVYGKRIDRAWYALSVLKEKFSVTHVVWPVGQGDFPFPKMGRKVFKDGHFSVWDIRNNDIKTSPMSGFPVTKSVQLPALSAIEVAPEMQKQIRIVDSDPRCPG